LRSIKYECPIGSTYFDDVFSPVIPVEVRLASGIYLTFHFELDSGADCTLVPRQMANATGFKLPEYPDATTTGVFGRPAPVYKGKIHIRLLGQELDVRCLFAESARTPLLLGRVDIFDRFDIKFSGRDRAITIEMAD
jgi:predicted aspartyl protease